MFLVSIPFLRNLIEFKFGNSHTDYALLTALLHIKTDPSKPFQTNNIKVKDLQNIYSEYLNITNLNHHGLETSIKDLLFQEANKILNQYNPNNDCLEIEDKIILSLGIRLKAEEFMWLSLTNKEYINGNQTGMLYDRFKKEFTGYECVKILEEVCIMTPENIHLNSFMYEPILDMSIHHLVTLYSKIITINLQ